MSLVTARWQWIASFSRCVEELNFDADGNLYLLEANWLGAGEETATMIRIMLYVVIDDCDSGVPDVQLSDGSTISGNIDGCAADASNHGDFVSCVV